MRPLRTITDLLCGPAIAITGRPDHPTTRQTAAPARPPASGRGGPPRRDLRGLGSFLGLGLVGLAVVLAGLVWDAVLHARNPELAHQEGLFTLSNPGHLLGFVGLVAVAVGTVGAAWTLFGLTTDPRRARPARCLLLVSVVWATSLSVVALNRAAIAESAAHEHGAGQVQASANNEASTGHVHATGHDKASPHQHATSPHQHATGSHQHATGSCQPTLAQRTTASKLVADTRLGLARFADLRDALAAGYAPHLRVREAVKHYFNPAYVTDGRALDPARPEGLLYAFTARGPVVVAAVYLTNRAGEPGRAVGGCLTQWHVHHNLCSSDPARGMITGVRIRDGACPRGQVPWAARPMLHTWVIDVPGGPFAAHLDASAVFRRLHTTPRPASG